MLLEIVIKDLDNEYFDMVESYCFYRKVSLKYYGHKAIMTTDGPPEKIAPFINLAIKCGDCDISIRKGDEYGEDEETQH